MPTVFITGVAGFLGSHLADAFLAKGYKVKGCDSLLGGYRDNVPKGVEFHEVDCVDLERMTAIMAGSDIVYHCAATAYEGLSVFSPHLVTQNIVQASVATFTAGVRNKVQRIVNCSSMARYGSAKAPFHETTPTQPQDPYGIGKLAAEDLLRNMGEVHGVQWVTAVPHNIYGPRQKYDDPFRNVASIFINRMLQGKQPIIYGKGEQKRCFSYVSDCVDPLIRMAEADNVVGQIINIGPDDNVVTINELAFMLGELLKFKVQPTYVDERPQEVFLATCSADKARKLLGYQPKVSLQEGLAANIAYIKERGVREFDYHLELEIVNAKTPKTWSQKLI